MARLPSRPGDIIAHAADVVRPASDGRSDRAAIAVGVERARASLEAGRIAEAQVQIDSLAAEHPDRISILQLRADVLRRQGAITDLVLTLHRLSAIDRVAARLVAERDAVGRFIETSPNWSVRVPGHRHTVEPIDDVVLYLLNESAPELTNGFTIRSRYNLAAAVTAGLRPVVATSLGFPRCLGVAAFAEIESIDGIPYHRLDLGPYYPTAPPPDMQLEHEAWLTARVARRVRPSVIHASSGRRGYETAMVGLAVSREIRRPLVYEVRSFLQSSWSDDDTLADGGEQFRRGFEAETRTMLDADHIITIAESMRSEIILRGVSPERVTVIPNGVDTGAFSPRPRDLGLTQRLRLEGHFVFGYVCSFDHPGEDVEVLIRATVELLQRGQRVRCLIVGDGVRRAELERFVQEVGGAESVIFVGRVPHEAVADYYALMDAFVVPCRDERTSRTVTPLKPYEAMAMQRPLVVSNLPALAEIVDSDRGLIFAPGDARALADRLELLIDDRPLASSLGHAARDWVVRERAWVSNGPRLRDTYRAVLDRWAATRREAH